MNKLQWNTNDDHNTVILLREIHWKYRLQNVGQFVQASTCQNDHEISRVRWRLIPLTFLLDFKVCVVTIVLLEVN